MNNMLYALYFGLGVAGFVYSRMGRRVGHGNIQNVWAVVGISFVMAMFFFYSLLAWVIHLH